MLSTSTFIWHIVYDVWYYRGAFPSGEQPNRALHMHTVAGNAYSTRMVYSGSVHCQDSYGNVGTNLHPASGFDGPYDNVGTDRWPAACPLCVQLALGSCSAVLTSI